METNIIVVETRSQEKLFYLGNYQTNEISNKQRSLHFLMAVVEMYSKKSKIASAIV